MVRKYSGKSKKGLNEVEKKEVKALMHGKAETKVASTNTGLVNHNSGISQGDLSRLLPSIAQGVREGQRVGNEIHLQTMTVSGLTQINWDREEPRSRIGVRVMMFSVKGFVDGTGAINNTASWINAILRDGIDVRPFNGNIRDYFLPHNNDIITMHAEKRFTLTNPFLYNTGISPDATTVPVQQQYSTKFWKAKLKCRNKVLKFTAQNTGAGAESVPENWGPLIAVGYCKLDGSSPDVLNTGLSQQINVQLTYED